MAANHSISKRWFFIGLSSILKNVGNLDFAYRARPWAKGSAGTETRLFKMDIAYRGRPFVQFKRIT